VPYRDGGLRDVASNTPVVQSTKFESVLNLKSAKTLGLTVPIGDEIIE
jgi:hypothetical protein